MKKMVGVVMLLSAAGILLGCASVPNGKNGEVDSPAALLSISLEGNANAYSQVQADSDVRADLSESSGLIFADIAEVDRVLQKVAEKARKKAASKARSARVNNFLSFANGSKSALNTVMDEMSIRGRSGIETIDAQSEFAQELQKELAKDEMTKCKSFVYITVVAGVMSKNGSVKPCARTIIRLNNKKGKTIRSVMAVCGAEPIATENARADRSLVSAAFPALVEQSLHLAAENLYEKTDRKSRFTMETESLVTDKPFMIPLSTWK